MRQDDYLYGECHVFALALQEVFGYQMKFALDEFDEELEREVLIHAFCFEGDHVIDARGISHASDVLEPYDYNDVHFEEVELSALEQMMESGFVHRPDDGQYKELVQYLLDNKETYQVKMRDKQGEL